VVGFAAWGAGEWRATAGVAVIGDGGPRSLTTQPFQGVVDQILLPVPERERDEGQRVGFIVDTETGRTSSTTGSGRWLAIYTR